MSLLLCQNGLLIAAPWSVIFAAFVVGVARPVTPKPLDPPLTAAEHVTGPAAAPAAGWPIT